MDTGNNTLKIYDGSGWAAVGGAGGGGSTVVSPTAPSTPTNGSLWYDTTNGVLRSTLLRQLTGFPHNSTFLCKILHQAAVFTRETFGTARL